MRLYNTLSRQLEELPAPHGPIRMYFCGPTVYQRAHIGNARPFLLGMWLRNWLRHRGYDATLVHNITDVNDKISTAARVRARKLASEATEWYLQDIGDFELGLPDALPKATEHIPQHRFLHRAARSSDGHAYAVEGDVYFRVARDPGVRAPFRPAPRSDGGAGAEPAQGGSARLRALEGEQARRGHSPGSRPGDAAGQAGTSSAR